MERNPTEEQGIYLLDHSMGTVTYLHLWLHKKDSYFTRQASALASNSLKHALFVFLHSFLLQTA